VDTSSNQHRYYLLLPEGAALLAFHPGFQMTSGDSLRQNQTIPVPDALIQKALGFNCLDYYHVANGPEPSLSRHFLPNKEYLDADYPDDLPSCCWNGQDADSGNHKGHVAFSSLVMDGDCPLGYEVCLPSLYYGIIWNTTNFIGRQG
jgi:hypothetical protein